MILKDKIILNTGTDGFIGSHLTEVLVQVGHKVRAFVLYNSWGWLSHADLSIQKSHVDFSGDIHDSHGITSTSKVCGTARFVKITEEHPMQGQSPHLVSKIGADQIALSLHSSFANPVAIIRPFNTYGPRQFACAIIPSCKTQIANGQPSFTLASLHPIIDFIYLKGMVRGFLALAFHELADKFRSPTYRTRVATSGNCDKRSGGKVR